MSSFIYSNQNTDLIYKSLLSVIIPHYTTVQYIKPGARHYNMVEVLFLRAFGTLVDFLENSFL